MTGAAALSWQPSLFTGAAAVPDASFRHLTRLELGDGCWVDHAPGWLQGSDTLFAELLDTLPWAQRNRWMYDRRVEEPRLTAGWRPDGEGGGTAGDRGSLRPAVLETARRVLSTRYGVEFDSVGVNLYRGGRDSVAWHRDRIPTEVVDPIVALLSLGEPRRFLLRPHGGGPSRAWLLGRGDLLVTGGGTQRRWDHSVPKVARAGPRISVAYRHGMR